MTRYELLKIHESLIKVLLENKVNLHDIEYLAIYEQFVEMKAKHKVSYVVCYLADKFSVTERTIYGIVSRFDHKVNV